MFGCCAACDDSSEKAGRAANPVTSLSASVVAEKGLSVAAQEKTAEEPPPEKLQGVTLVFKQNGVEKSAVLNNSPLGFRFRAVVPIVVSKVHAGSEAEEKGVAEGMELVSIAGEAVQGKTYPELLARLQAVAKSLRRD